MNKISKALVYAVVVFAGLRADAASKDGFFQPELQPRANVESSPIQEKRGKFSFDLHGRLVHFVRANGKSATFDYDVLGRVSKISLEGRSPGILIYPTAFETKPSSIVIGGRLYSLPFQGPASTSSLQGKASARVVTPNQVPPPGDIDEYAEYFREMMREYANCPLCVGVFDDLQGAINNLSSWLQVGGALGTIVGAALAETVGAAATEYAIAMGLGALAGITIVTAFMGGYVVGTFIYDAGGNLIWSNI